jgi:molybdate transport system substrate-binding protein
VRACLLLLFLLANFACAAQEITVAAASDLQFALQEVKAQFGKQTGIPIRTVYGSSGNLCSQIENGAPFDLFFSADIAYAQRLESEGLAQPGTLYEYAAGKLVLWAPRKSRLDLDRGVHILLNPHIGKIAIANPQHAPYGRAAVAALRHEGIYDQVAGKLVLGENITQTASFVVSGTADVGIIALSLALAPSLKDNGKYTLLPTGEYPAIRQAAVILKSSKQKQTAEQFLAYLKTPTVVALLQQYGFVVPSQN